MSQRFSLILSVFLFCGIISCGNTGDLYLPEETTSTQDRDY
ncbi:MAG: LPS translocon maturation chaperone LptM [Porticoccaceae bacterium]